MNKIQQMSYNGIKLSHWTFQILKAFPPPPSNSVIKGSTEAISPHRNFWVFRKRWNVSLYYVSLLVWCYIWSFLICGLKLLVYQNISIIN